MSKTGGAVGGVMDQERYGDFSLRLNQRVHSLRVPISGTLEISHRCPLECLHCYNNLPMSDHAARKQELTYQEYCRILDELAAAGCLWLLFSGGEIFARKDFLDIYTYAKRKGFLITLFTNGTLISPRIADYLVDLPPFCIEITLYGRTKETYERLTAVPGSYEKCLIGIKLLQERNLPLKLKTVGVSTNVHEIWEMQRFAEEDLGVEFKFDSMINPRIDCSQSPLAVRLKPAEIVALDLGDPRRVEEWHEFAEEYGGPVHQDDQLYHCGGGINSFAIDPYGMMSICVLSHVDKYNLRTGSFQEGWNHFLYEVRFERKIQRLTKCQTCDLKSMCGMCPANGELENNDAEKPVDFLCQVAHLRAYAFNLSVRPHGDCEFCVDGSRYSEMVEQLALLEKLNLGSRMPSTRSLPVLSSGGGCSSGGCSSCHA